VFEPDDNFFSASFEFGQENFPFENKNQSNILIEDASASESKTTNFFLNPFTAQPGSFGNMVKAQEPASELAHAADSSKNAQVSQVKCYVYTLNDAQTDKLVIGPDQKFLTLVRLGRTSLVWVWVRKIYP